MIGLIITQWGESLKKMDLGSYVWKTENIYRQC